MPVQSVLSTCENDTLRLAQQLAAHAKAGDVYYLTGDLGAGKTAFARGFIRYFLKDENVPSPTFTLVQTYDTDKGTIWHFDLYRLKKAEDVFELGLEDALADGITLVEWPERIDRYAFKNVKRIRFDILDGQTRKISYDF